MLKFVWCYMSVVFAILYGFQFLGMMAMGDYAMFVGMLFLTFVLIKDEKIKEMIASNICLIVVILILWSSDETFHYIQNTGMLFIFVGAMVIAELFGGFWGRKFARNCF